MLHSPGSLDAENPSCHNSHLSIGLVIPAYIYRPHKREGFGVQNEAVYSGVSGGQYKLEGFIGEL